MTRNQEWLSAIRASVPRAVWFFLLGFEILLCLRLIGYDLSSGTLPCPDKICSLVAQDSLSRPLGLYLPWFGCGLGLATLSIRLIGRRSVADVLTGLGCIVSVGLVLYMRTKFGGVCSWCAFSATCWCAAFIVNTLDTSSGKVSATPVVVALALGLFAESFVSKGLTANSLNLGASSWELLRDASDPITAGSNQKEVVLLVEMSCGSCRSEMRNALKLPLTSNVRVMSAKCWTEYDRQATKLLIDCRTVQDRRYALNELLNDDSMIEAAVAPIRKHLKMSPVASFDADQKLATQLLSSSNMNVKVVPTRIYVDAHKHLLTVPPKDE